MTGEGVAGEGGDEVNFLETRWRERDRLDALDLLRSKNLEREPYGGEESRRRGRDEREERERGGRRA